MSFSLRRVSRSEFLVVIMLLAILVGILYPVFINARSTSRQSTCLHNQRQLVQQFLLYAQEHKGIMPFAADAWHKISVHPDTLRCLETDKTVQHGYVYHANLSNTSIAEFKNADMIFVTADGANTGSPKQTVTVSLRTTPPTPSTPTVIIPEQYPHVAYSDEHIQRRHRGKAIFSYLDGHADIGTEAIAPPKDGLKVWLKSETLEADNPTIHNADSSVRLATLVPNKALTATPIDDTGHFDPSTRGHIWRDQSGNNNDGILIKEHAVVYGKTGPGEGVAANTPFLRLGDVEHGGIVLPPGFANLNGMAFFCLFRPTSSGEVYQTQYRGIFEISRSITNPDMRGLQYDSVRFGVDRYNQSLAFRISPPSPIIMSIRTLKQLGENATSIPFAQYHRIGCTQVPYNSLWDKSLVKDCSDKEREYSGLGMIMVNGVVESQGMFFRPFTNKKQPKRYIAIGGSQDERGWQYNPLGDMSEVLIYDRGLNKGEMLQVDWYLKWKYAMPY